MSELSREHDDELARKTAQLARRAAEFQLLQRVSSDINSTLDLEEIYDAALRAVGELFEFHHAIILLIEPDGQTLAVVASRGYETQAIGGRVRIGTGVIGWWHRSARCCTSTTWGSSARTPRRSGGR
jgi:GAF domain-containing protein